MMMNKEDNNMKRIFAFSLILLLFVSVLPVQDVKAEEEYLTFEEYFSQFDLSGNVYEQFITTGLSTKSGFIYTLSNCYYYFHFVCGNTKYIFVNHQYQPYINYDDRCSISGAYVGTSGYYMGTLSWENDCVLQ